MRSTTEVFTDHLELRLKGDIETDINRNYDQDVVLISSVDRFEGHDGVRASAEQLSQDIGDARFEYVKTAVEGEFAFLIWKAKSDTKVIHHGVDSFLIRDGKILVQ